MWVARGKRGGGRDRRGEPEAALPGWLGQPKWASTRSLGRQSEWAGSGELGVSATERVRGEGDRRQAARQPPLGSHGR